MIGKNSEDLDICSLEAFVPRGLIGCGVNVFNAKITPDGLCPLRIVWQGNSITKLEVVNKTWSKSESKLLLPRFIEPHAHIDKAFTWSSFPSFDGTYEEALRVNLKEHQTRTAEKVLLNAEQSLKLALRNGYRAIRSHIDSFGPFAYETWDVLLELKRKWKDIIELQLVAMVPLNYWSTNEGRTFAHRIAKGDGVLGGVIVPPLNIKTTRNCLFDLLKLANDLGCELDLHIDESDSEPAAGLKILINLLDQIAFYPSVTCSHLSSMSLLPERAIERFADSLARHGVNVVALPLTNSWLLGRRKEHSPIKRPFAPVKQLQKAGVNVAIGWDNVQDSWFPGGNFDPLSLMAFAMPIVQLAPWKRLGLAPLTTSPSRLMNTKWDGTLGLNSPVDFVCLEAENWMQAMYAQPKREVIVQGKFLNENCFDAF